MASKRVPTPHLHRPHPGPGAMHPDPYAPSIRPPHGGGFPHFEMLPPHELMAHKLSAQHLEIEKLVTENRRLAATHGTLRQDLATAQHDLQLIHAHIADVKSEKEQQMKVIVDKMSAMDSELESAETIKTELQKAHAEAQSSVATRQELITKAQQLDHDLRKAHSEAHQIPALMAELDSLRQEYQHCRATYDYEKKLYSDHLESLQVMEQNYMAMSREVEKLRAELSNSANFDPQTGLHNANAGVPYSGSAGYNEGAHVGHYAPGQNPYAVGQQGQVPHPVGGANAGGTGGNSDHVLGQSRGTGYDPQRGHVGASYDAQRGPTHNNNNIIQKGPGNRPGYDARQGSVVYQGQTAPVYDMQRGGLGDGNQTGANYESQNGAVGPPQGQVSSANTVPYASTPNTRAATAGYEPVQRGGNPVRR